MPAHLADEPHGGSPTNRRQDVYETPASQVLERGEEFFDKCYGKVAERVRTSLDHSGTEDLGLAVRLAYGYVLSTTAILSEVETSFVMIAGLIPQDVSAALCFQPDGELSCHQTGKGNRGQRALALAGLVTEGGNSLKRMASSRVDWASSGGKQNRREANYAA